MSNWPEVSTPSSELKLSREKKEVARWEFLSLCKEKDASLKEVKAHAACACCELCLKLDSLSAESTWLGEEQVATISNKLRSGNEK